MNDLLALFTKDEIVTTIQEKLPKLFYTAEIESRRSNQRLGMEIGIVRERIIISLLMKYLGERNISHDIPIDRHETDVMINNQPISIKTITSRRPKGVKILWTSDADKVTSFINKYEATCDLIYVHINWGRIGGIHFIPKQVQNQLLNNIGKEKYFKIPKLGTSSKGVEISNSSITSLINHKNTSTIEITWNKPIVKETYCPFARWKKMW